MQHVTKIGTAVPLYKPRSPYGLLKLSQAIANPLNGRQLISQPARDFSYKPRRSVNRKRNSRSPGRSSSPGGVYYYPPQQHHTFEPVEVTPEEPKASQSVFDQDSTFTLCKKLVIYKMMGSNLFINYSLMGISAAYKILGTKLTNFAIENTAASVFTGGVTTSDLMVNEKELEKRNIGTIGCYVVEGVRDAKNQQLDDFLDFSVKSIREVTEVGKEGHFALKLTAYISTDLMEKLSEAQQRFCNEVLEVKYDAADNSVLSKDQLAANLAELGIVEYSRQDFDQFAEQLSQGSNSHEMTNIARYTNGHLFNIYGAERSPLMTQIGQKLGGLTEGDFANLDKFAGRVLHLSEVAKQRDCRLYVDAEQTFIQAAIESFAQQLTQNLNVAENVTIMNGYQCYLKRMTSVIPMEVRAATENNFNLGIKLIRGAYMMEERELAAKQGQESPVWDSIEDTHSCYNDSMEHIIRNMKPEGSDMLFVASHNTDTCELAMTLSEELDLKDKNCVRFGQLKGFSDQVTSDISQKGFQVFKYLPFGPTEQVMPYLVRRGQESRQVLREQQFQNTFLKAEILKRLGF